MISDQMSSCKSEEHACMYVCMQVCSFKLQKLVLILDTNNGLLVVREKRRSFGRCRTVAGFCMFESSPRCVAILLRL